MSKLGKSRQEQIAGGELAPRVVSPSISRTLAYRSMVVEGLNIFYREAGPPNAPTLLLLHGYPSSSRMFDTLLPLLADSYRLIAPDYPGFGQSEFSPADEFVYSFEHLGEIVLRFTNVLGLTKYTLLMQDYGGPIGFRLAVANPRRVEALIVQKADASEDDLGSAWEIRKAYWKDREACERKVIPEFVSVESFKRRHIGSSKRPERYNPDSWLDEHAQVSQPGRSKIQADLFWTYQTNVASYPVWQERMRHHKPPTLVLWGRHDVSFTIAGAPAYQREIPDAEVHILDAGHFTFDECLDESANLIRDFLKRHLLFGPRPARLDNPQQTSKGE